MRFIDNDAPVLVVGFGNVLRGDDGAGPAAAAALRRQLPRRIAEVLAVHQLLPELAERLSRCTLAIFIDADWNAPPGQILRQDLLAQYDGGGVLAHQQSLENLLSMARELYGHAPPAILFHIGAADFSFQQGLSEPVRQAVAQLVTEVVDAVHQATLSLEPGHA